MIASRRAIFSAIMARWLPVVSSHPPDREQHEHHHSDQNRDGGLGLPQLRGLEK
jgi:hypothetical protein